MDACGSAFAVGSKQEAPADPRNGDRRREDESNGLAQLPAGRGNPGDLWLWTAFLVVSVPIFALNPGIFVGETVNSRLASVYALVHDGSWHIDTPAGEPRNPFEAMTVDKVQTPNGRMISSKPPVLPLMMTAEYAVLHGALGWQLTDPRDLKATLRVMIATLIKVPYVLGMLFFALLLRFFVPDRRKAALLLLAMAFASPILGYAFQINNHTPSAAALCGALYFGLGIYAEKLKPTPWRFAAFGFCSAFVFVTDIPITIFPAMLGLLLFSKYPKACAVWGTVGAAPLLLLHFSLMTVITGSPLPVQTRESMFNFRNSYWRNPIGVDGLNESWYVYLFHMMFGRFGTFMLFPILLLAFPGMVRMLAGRVRDMRVAAMAFVAAFALLTAYYVLKTNNYGGAAYGFRWHIGAVPVLLFLAIPQANAMKRWYHWFLAGMLAVISVYSAWECMVAPWGASHEWTCRWIWGPVF